MVHESSAQVQDPAGLEKILDAFREGFYRIWMVAAGIWDL